MFHQELDGIAGYATAKTLEDAFRWRNRERRGFFIVKRTKALHIHAPLFERHKVADHFFDTDGFQYFVYGSLANQGFVSLFLLRYDDAGKQKSIVLSEKSPTGLEENLFPPFSSQPEGYGADPSVVSS
jgi:hypothetical protein